MMRAQSVARRLVIALATLGLVVQPAAAASLAAVHPRFEAAKRKLYEISWTPDAMSWRLDDTTFDPAAVGGGRIAKDCVDAHSLDAVLRACPICENLRNARFDEPLTVPEDGLASGLQPLNAGLVEAARVHTVLVELAAHDDVNADAFIGFPRMFAVRFGGLANPGGGEAINGGRVFNVLSNVASVRGGEAIIGGRVFNILSNVTSVRGEEAVRRRAKIDIDNIMLKYLTSDGDDAEKLNTTMTEAATQEIEWWAVAPGDAAAREALHPDPLSAGLIDADLKAGYVVVAPEKPVLIGDRPVYNWLRIDPRTGETLGRGDLGDDIGPPPLD